jgi:sec-independent protein translocase protein TatC
MAVEKAKPAELSGADALIDKYYPFFLEVRKRIVFTLSVFAVASVGGFIFYEKIIKFLIGALGLGGINIVFTSPFQFINLSISCGVAVGLIFVSPLLISQILSFLKPALKNKEFKKIVGFLPFSVLLFITGFSFGALIMRWQIQIFLEKSVSLGIGNILDISNLLTTILLTSAFMGVGFQFPIILLLLIFVGVISPHQLRQQRRWVYLGSLIFAILLPADSILADFLLTLPFIILFELTLIFDFLFKRTETR